MVHKRLKGILVRKHVRKGEKRNEKKTSKQADTFGVDVQHKPLSSVLRLVWLGLDPLRSLESLDRRLVAIDFMIGLNPAPDKAFVLKCRHYRLAILIDLGVCLQGAGDQRHGGSDAGGADTTSDEIDNSSISVIWRGPPSAVILCSRFLSLSLDPPPGSACSPDLSMMLMHSQTTADFGFVHPIKTHSYDMSIINQLNSISFYGLY